MAINLFLGPTNDPATPRRLAKGQPADLCVLATGWREARLDPAPVVVVATMVGGVLTHGTLP